MKKTQFILKLIVRVLIFPIHIVIFLLGGIKYYFALLTAWAWNNPNQLSYREKIEAYNRAHAKGKTSPAKRRNGK